MGPGSPPRIAVLGAGPVGVEAAIYARSLGYPVSVYEAERIGHHLMEWGHVTLFTPWALNVSTLGERRLRDTSVGTANWDLEACPTGSALVQQYLEPLTRLPEMTGVIRTGHRVVSIGRGALRKGDGVGDGSRAGVPFRILIETPEGERIEEADAVLDATGVFGHPNPLGRGGIPARGERALSGRIDTGLPDVSGRARDRYQGRRILVVGGGLSAATTVTSLSRLPGTRVHWVTLAGTPPLPEIPGDPLPHRLALTREANRLALEPPPGFTHHPATSVLSLGEAAGAVEVRLGGLYDETAIVVDRVIAQTGFRPDLGIHRELQVHPCYATEGPMRLSAALLKADRADCLEQTGFGPESLIHPEPGFFTLGHKSYGRGSQFLLQVGRDQVRDVFRILSGLPELDLFAPEGSHV